jgi:hypothetical protein
MLQSKGSFYHPVLSVTGTQTQTLLCHERYDDHHTKRVACIILRPTVVVPVALISAEFYKMEFSVRSDIEEGYTILRLTTNACLYSISSFESREIILVVDSYCKHIIALPKA